MARDKARTTRRGKGRGRSDESGDDTSTTRLPRGRGAKGKERKAGKERKIGKPPKARKAELPNKGIDPSVVELKPYTGNYRESHVIEVQPIALALEDSDDVLFGKLAIASGFVTKKQIKQCIQRQKEQEDESGFLGDLLIAEKILRREEVEEVLRIQHRNLQKQYKYTRHKRDEALFGRLIRENEFASESQVNECVRQQAEMEHFDEKVPLGELLLAKGFITEEAIEEVLNFQKMREYFCPHCEARLTISLFEFGRKLRCTECQKKFTLPETPESEELKMNARTTKFKRAPARKPERAPDEVPAVKQEDSSSGERRRKKKKKRKRPEPAAEVSTEDAESLNDSSGDEGREIVKGWFLALLGRGYGPLGLRLTRKLLKLGIFGPDDLFWNRKLDGWTPARKAEALAPYLTLPDAQSQSTGPSKPGQVSSPKRLADLIDNLLAQHRLAEEDHQKLRTILGKPFVE